MTGCEFKERREFFWGKGVVDPVEFDTPEGVRLFDTFFCPYVSEPGKKYCPKHALVVGSNPDREEAA